MADLGYDKNSSLSIIETLQNHKWLDLQSRAVIFEYFAFNPPTNLLIVATYFYELRPSGFKASFHRINTISVHSKETGLHKLYLVCVLLFIILTLLYVVRIFYTVYKQRSRFFSSIWNFVEILQVVFSLLAVVFNIVKSSEAVSTIRSLKQNVYANVNFQEVIAWTDAEKGVLGILLFLVTLKLLRLIRHNEQVAIFSQTLALFKGVFYSFIGIFTVGFMAFTHFGILIFGSVSIHYSSFLRAIYFQLELILRKVRREPVDELLNGNSEFGKIFTVLILLSLTILLMNFFIGSINCALTAAKKSITRNKLHIRGDEFRSANDKLSEKLSDTCSQAITQGKTKGMKKVRYAVAQRRLHTSTQKSENKADHDKSLTSEQRTRARLVKHEEASPAKRNSTPTKLLPGKAIGIVKQLKKTPFEIVDLQMQLKELKHREERLFQCLGNIIQADNEEEEAYDFLARFAQRQLAYAQNSISAANMLSIQTQMVSVSSIVTRTTKFKVKGKRCLLTLPGAPHWKDLGKHTAATRYNPQATQLKPLDRSGYKAI